MKEVRGIEGVRVCRNAPLVSHLLFADDSLILIKLMQPHCDKYLTNIVQGPLVSLVKCSIYFSRITLSLEKKMLHCQ